MSGTRDNTDHLEPIEPAAAVELYPKEKEAEVSEWTLFSHGSRLGHFTVV